MSHASEDYRKQCEAHEALNKKLKAEGKPKVYMSSEVAIPRSGKIYTMMIEDDIGTINPLDPKNYQDPNWNGDS